MFKALLQKQLLELNQSFFKNKKTGKRRSATSAVISIILFAVLIVAVIGGMFFFLAQSMSPLITGGFGWLYITILSLLSIVFGVFGSVFNTYASVYQAKDNDLLLSLPIPVPYILAVRLSGVYLMGLMYSAVVSVPSLIVYCMYAKPAAGPVIGYILLILLISVLVLVLSCALGWVVAKISSKLKNKSLITVIASLAFIAVYYVLYFRATELLQVLIANASVIGNDIRSSAYPLYMLGRCGEGDVLSLLIYAAVILSLFALTYYVLSHSFIRLATGTGTVQKTKFREKAEKRKSPDAALLGKEFGRLLASPTYMLNCSLGTLLLPVAAVVLLIKSSALRSILPEIFGDTSSGLLSLILSGAICMLATMNDLTAPSITLEGKCIWLPQSLPVSAWQILRAKLRMHLFLTGIPTLFCSICAAIVFQPDPLSCILLILMPQIFMLLHAAFGLAVNLKMPNLKWTNEATAVKQSIGVLFALFGGWIYLIALGALYFAVYRLIGENIFLLLCTVLTSGLAAVLLFWLKKRGTAIFETL